MSMRYSKSSVKYATHCLCGSINFKFDMEKLCQEKSHKQTLLHMAEIIDILIEEYIEQKRKETDPPLRVIK